MARRVLAVLAIGVLVFSPVSAVATGLDDDPRPVEWPQVDEPTDTNGGGTDPQPLAPPTVEKPETGAGTDPKPTEWPAPQEQ